MGETDHNGWYTDDKLQVVRMCICNTTEGAKGGRSNGQSYAMVKEGTTVQTMAREKWGKEPTQLRRMLYDMLCWDV
jgi:hypothetical protein